jgi:hypothetical protein
MIFDRLIRLTNYFTSTSAEFLIAYVHCDWLGLSLILVQHGDATLYNVIKHVWT